MSDTPLTWPMIAALPLDAERLPDTLLAAAPCLVSPPVEAPGLARALVLSIET